MTDKIPLHVMEISLQVNYIKLGQNATDIYLQFIPQSNLEIKTQRSKLLNLNTNCRTPVHNTRYFFQCQLNRSTLSSFLQQDNLEIAVYVKNKSEEYKYGSALLPFSQLKTAQIVEKENTLKKQMQTSISVQDDNMNPKGEIEYTLSIEDFGDIDIHNASSFVTNKDDEQDYTQSQSQSQNYNKSQPQHQPSQQYVNNNNNKMNEMVDNQVEDSQQRFLKQYSNVVNTSKQMQNMRKTFDEQNLGGGPSGQTDKSYQLFWEFEIWKKTEEMNFRQALKEKEEEHLTAVTDKYKHLEKQREAAFTKAINEISSLEGKLRTKIGELQKRESSVIIYETELTRKIEDAIKQVTAKDQDILELRNQVANHKKELKATCDSYESRLKTKDNTVHQLESELYSLKTNMEDSSITRLRQEIDSKNDQIHTLKSKLQVTADQLTEYRTQSDKYQKKYEGLRREFEEYKEQKLREKEEEIHRIKLEQKKYEMKTIERDNLASIKQQLMSLAGKSRTGLESNEGITRYEGTPEHFPPTTDESDRTNMNHNQANRAKPSLPSVNMIKSSPSKMPLLGGNNKENNYIQSKKYEDEGKLARLIKERNSLLEMGYAPKDDLIKEIDYQIKELNGY